MTNVLQALNVNGFADPATVGEGVACRASLLSAHACQADVGEGGAKSDYPLRKNKIKKLGDAVICYMYV